MLNKLFFSLHYKIYFNIDNNIYQNTHRRLWHSMIDITTTNTKTTAPQADPIYNRRFSVK